MLKDLKRGPIVTIFLKLIQTSTRSYADDLNVASRCALFLSLGVWLFSRLLLYLVCVLMFDDVCANVGTAV